MTHASLPRHSSLPVGSTLHHSSRSVDYDWNPSFAFPPKQLQQAPQPALQTNRQHSLTLFDPRQPQYPNPYLMPQFIQTFFQEMGNNFSFLSYDETMGRLYHKTLSAVIANCIAALAVRYSDVQTLTGVDSITAAGSYEDNAKITLGPDIYNLMVNLDTLHSLMLLAWIEQKNGKAAGFQSYCQIAMRIADRLALSNETVGRLNARDPQHRMMRDTWSSLVSMHDMASIGA